MVWLQASQRSATQLPADSLDILSLDSRVCSRKSVKAGATVNEYQRGRLLRMDEARKLEQRDVCFCLGQHIPHVGKGGMQINTPPCFPRAVSTVPALSPNSSYRPATAYDRYKAL
jgi:hypothetical protein